MPRYTDSLNRLYAPTDICARIVERLCQAGKDLETLTRDDLAPFDEFHGGGRASTRSLARLAGVRPGARVLDVGSGIGGPARTLAAEFGCVVTGIDLTAEYCRAAQMLTEKVGLSSAVRFECANALDMPFPTGAFDVVWSQNTLMNIEDKARLCREVHRVLRPGGMFAFEVILAGAVAGIHFPVFWAESPALNFLVTPAEMKTLLAEAGLHERHWEDATEATITNQRRRIESIERDGLPLLGLDVIVQTDFRAKLDNVLRNNEEARTVNILAVYTRPS